MMRTVCTFILLMLTLYTAAQLPYEEEIQLHRDTTNMEFANPKTSILDSVSMTHFDGLDYFPVNESFKIQAHFRKKVFKKKFEMATSTSRKPVYRKYGVLSFELDGKKHKLVVYQNVDLSKKEGYEDYLFCPFNDLTNGTESYGGGRYLDFKIGALTTHPVIDFNLCYNPYCAYNYKYSCPIPPRENRLNVRIEAGVKVFAHP